VGLCESIWRYRIGIYSMSSWGGEGCGANSLQPERRLVSTWIVSDSLRRLGRTASDLWVQSKVASWVAERMVTKTGGRRSGRMGQDNWLILATPHSVEKVRGTDYLSAPLAFLLVRSAESLDFFFL
jgi:hypothetical protein